MLRIVLIGPPGAGKGTYARYFSKKYCIPHISTGDIFREEVAKGTELGKRIKDILDRGELVPDEIVIEIVRKRLRQPDTAKGFILDGFPRTIRQAEALDEIATLDAVIHIYITMEEAVRRLSNRYICPKCGRVYNLLFNPPKNDLRCDDDGTPLIRRSDDEPEVIRRRYKIYYETFQPIIEYYKKKNLLIEIDNTIGSDKGIPLLERTLIDKGILKLKPCNPNVSIK
ncbi:adenylate kinase [Staphylothermus hellenicus]|uniref:Adenylate kinase n=1 Tax=Staphylothermus hellenicus (strain DSM 12710 / JCM 10830 / BK20S6-10-b1 / P8) TaxID=591019 RepID=D7DBI8_STAHD|nr:adenylate kinase [Staphylothermus hellenicus]ADI31535.1 adenylate kinase [Staphylothermus hellenicus DSM 12710]